MPPRSARGILVKPRQHRSITCHCPMEFRSHKASSSEPGIPDACCWSFCSTLGGRISSNFSNEERNLGPSSSPPRLVRLLRPCQQMMTWGSLTLVQSIEDSPPLVSTVVDEHSSESASRRQSETPKSFALAGIIATAPPVALYARRDGLPVFIPGILPPSRPGRTLREEGTATSAAARSPLAPTEGLEDEVLQAIGPR